jgi:hypothetical protein
LRKRVIRNEKQEITRGNEGWKQGEERKGEDRRERTEEREMHHPFDGFLLK